MCVNKARQATIDAISALDLGVDVQAYADNRTITEPTVMVRVDRARPGAHPRAWRSYDVALLVIAPKTEVGPADDQLDDLLEDVLLALEESPDLITWTTAERAVYQDAQPAYEVTLQVPVTKEP